jgi:hypothetical protein
MGLFATLRIDISITVLGAIMLSVVMPNVAIFIVMLSVDILNVTIFLY